MVTVCAQLIPCTELYCVHCVQKVKDILQSAGIMVIFLPPYSPDYNPCEELFSYYLKDHDDKLLLCSVSTNLKIF